MRVSTFFVLCLFTIKVIGQSPIMENEEAMALIKKATFHIYNTENQQAIGYINKLQDLLPNYPAAPMMHALNINWSHFPLDTESKEFASLKKHLLTSLERTEEILDKDDENIEGIFFAMSIHSWLAQFYDEAGSTFKALSSAKKAYHYMKKGFDLTDQSAEFYFSTGLFNYYRVQYPESNPVYKPFMWFFRSGDKALGIKQLKIASQQALFTKSEAAMYLAHLYLRYEKDPISALTYSRSLIKSFPKNPVFKVNYVEALLEARRYAEAKLIIEGLLGLPEPFFRMSAEIFHGMYLEKHMKELTKAKAFYLKGIDAGASLGDKAENRLSFAYAGLARIAHKEGDQEQALTYYKKASKLAQYRTIKEEAKAYQNAN